MAAVFSWSIFLLLLTITLAYPAPNNTRAFSSRCPSAGFFCLDKDTVGLCVASGGQYIGYVTDTCTNLGEFCSHSLKKCSTKPSIWSLPQYTGDHFPCNQQGTFPDPYDCNVYHSCPAPLYATQEDYAPTTTHICEAGTAYNTGTGNCDLPSSHPMCAEDGFPIEWCGGGLKGGAVSLNPNYFWMCVDGFIRVFQCENNYVFDANTFRCVSDGGVGIVPPTTPSSTAFACSSTGRHEDPASCYRYFDCSDITKPVRHSCPLGKYFHRRKKICHLGFCPY